MSRTTHLAIGLCMVLLALSLGLTAYSLRHEPANPLRYSHPQMIIGSHTLHRGEEFNVYRQKCNDSDVAVSVLLISSDWRLLNGGGTPYRVGNVPLSIGPHECNERTGVNMIPSDLPFGWYVLEGLDCIVPAKVICVSWKTELFEVVP